MDEMTDVWTHRRIEPSSALLLLVTATALAGTVYLRYRSSAALESLTVGSRLPPLQLADLETSEPHVLVASAGKVVWVTFWSGDSPTAMSTLTALEQASKRLAHHRRFVQVPAVIEAREVGQVRESLRSHRIRLPAYSASATVLRQFGVSSADPPFHALIGRDGRILALARGSDDSTLARLAAMAQQQLDELDPKGTLQFAALSDGIGRQVGCMTNFDQPIAWCRDLGSCS
jgi:hypothetical protein